MIFLQKYIFHIGLIIVCLSFGFYKGHSSAVASYEAKIAKATLVHNNKIISIERALQKELEDKQRELNNEKEKTTIAINNAESQLNSLHNKVDAYRRKYEKSKNSKSSCPFTKTNSKAWTLFKDCTKRYKQMGETADRLRDNLNDWQSYGEVILDYNKD